MANDLYPLDVIQAFLQEHTYVSACQLREFHMRIPEEIPDHALILTAGVHLDCVQEITGHVGVTPDGNNDILALRFLCSFTEPFEWSDAPAN